MQNSLNNSYSNSQFTNPNNRLSEGSKLRPTTLVEGVSSATVEQSPYSILLLTTCTSTTSKAQVIIIMSGKITSQKHASVTHHNTHIHSHQRKEMLLPTDVACFEQYHQWWTLNFYIGLTPFFVNILQNYTILFIDFRNYSSWKPQNLNFDEFQTFKWSKC